MTKNFIFNLCNIRGLSSNLNAVHHHLLSCRPHALFLTETQISQPSADNHLQCPGYFLFSNFRLKSGVCAYVRSDIAVSRIESLDICKPEFQLIWLKISTLNYVKAVWCVRPAILTQMRFLIILKFVLRHYKSPILAPRLLFSVILMCTAAIG